MSARPATPPDAITNPVYTSLGEFSDSNLALVFGTERLYVNRTVLEIASPIFKQQLANEMKHEKGENLLELRFKKSVFTEFLTCFYPGKVGDVDEYNVFRILPLAYKYQIERVKQKCLVILTQSLKHGITKEYLYKCLDTARKYGLNGVGRTCLQIITDYYKKNIQQSDELLTLEAEVKSAVSSSIIPVLRSEACKYRYLTAGPAGNEMFVDLGRFDDAKYAKTTFKLSRRSNESTVQMDDFMIWDVKLKLDREMDVFTNERFTLFLDEKSKVCRTALKMVFKNAIPGGEDEIFQNIRDDLPLLIKVQKKAIMVNGILWNNIYTVEIHCLMNKPSM